MPKISGLSLFAVVLAMVAGTSYLYCQDDFEKWKKQEADKYQQWKDARDKEFTEFLKADWKAFHDLPLNLNSRQNHGPNKHRWRK
jgi:hypothetical protein